LSADPNYTVFVSGISTGAKPLEAVTAFMTFLQGPTALAAIKAKGMRVD
jgi:hypothetical protein